MSAEAVNRQQKRKPELLAPAGNYQALIGAFCAGADAVYLGGDKFGARAYADNFSKEEICEALRYAHFLGKKIYLTVNTLIKEEEFSELLEYLTPFYEAGLDGIIIQDLGVWQYVRRHFPDLALHASTQMTITGPKGAAFLKEIGAQRIVPARELSLAEIKQIKEQTGLELECFIHGAMCYCYSGQCLFSSILGGRSGNRGRCAQPCRLPYQILDAAKSDDIKSVCTKIETASKKQPKEMYPLSLKDMCTLAYLPKLIESGIDSFKIEGRMKKPEYAAGVTAIYRKYIDAYYENGMQSYQVLQEDMDRLQKLYIRSEIQTGYYERTNGREMITLQKPSYLGSDEALLAEIAETYLISKPKMEVSLKSELSVGKPILLQITGKTPQGEVITENVYGETVLAATGRPLDKETVAKQLSKMGNSYLMVKQADISLEENVFLPIGKLNELRRAAVEAFENRVIKENGFLIQRTDIKTLEVERELIKKAETSKKVTAKPLLHVSVQTIEQLRAVLKTKSTVSRIYIESDLYEQEKEQIDTWIIEDGQEEKTQEENTQTAYYLALPHVIRAKDFPYLQNLVSNCNSRIKGFLVRNLEAAAFIRQYASAYDMVTDTGLYQFNKETAAFWNAYSQEGYLPYELNGREIRKLMSAANRRLSMVVYGTIPMMLTANCLKKTSNQCVHNDKSNLMYLQDRYKTIFPVIYHCKHCYNIIYNSVPLSLHKQKKELLQLGLYAVRLDFVQESAELTSQILKYYQKEDGVFPQEEYTTGHYKRGVE